jgi:hypothetical protein
MQFETRSLKHLTVKLRARTRELGVFGITIKNRWIKCRQVDDLEEEVAPVAPETRRIHQI